MLMQKGGLAEPFTEQSRESVGAQDGAKGGGGKATDAHVVVL